MSRINFWCTGTDISFESLSIIRRGWMVRSCMPAMVPRGFPWGFRTTKLVQKTRLSKEGYFWSCLFNHGHARKRSWADRSFARR